MTDYLTTKELASFLRIKERKVYDLAANGDVPCTRAMGKLLFPRQAVEDWLSRSSSGHGSEAMPATAQKRPPVFLGSHDPLLEWALRRSGCGLATYCDGSQDGLDRFSAYEGIATGLHIRNGDDWNVKTVKQSMSSMPVVLVEWVKRQRGIVLAPGVGGSVTGLQDVIERPFVARQVGAGSQTTLEGLLEESGWTSRISSPALVTHTEVEAALALREGKADWTFGLQSVARQNDLPFIPVLEERFDLIVDRHAWFEPGFQAFWLFCQSSEFHERAAELAGYDISGLGRVHFNSEVA